MPITHKILSDLKLVISTHSGLVPDDEFLASYRELLALDSFGLDFNQLIDLRDTKSHARSPEALHTTAKMIAQRYIGVNVSRKTAIIAPTNLSFGLSRMYEAFVPAISGDFVVFHSPEAALAWLKVPPDTLLD